jgi:hypothetical protein
VGDAGFTLFALEQAREYALCHESKTTMLLAGETLSVGNLVINQAPSQCSIGICLRGLKGLGALFELGGFVVAA